jgi:hypothetical protein
MPDTFTYDPQSGTFISPTGNRVPPETIRGWILDVQVTADEQLRKVAELFRAGKINDIEWALESADIIKNMHRAIAMVAAGGRDQMTLSDWGAVGQIVRRELQYFNGFAMEMDNMPPASTLTTAFVSRAASYARSAYSTYEQGVRRRILRNDLAEFEENILEDGARHCDGCLDESALGKVPIGTLTPVGDRDCGNNCKCMIIYSKPEQTEQETQEERSMVAGSKLWWAARFGLYEGDKANQ